MKTDYSPFPEGDFPKTAGDLQALKAVREGWFIEYKREQPSSKTVGKSISAFANTYGPGVNIAPVSHHSFRFKGSVELLTKKGCMSRLKLPIYRLFWAEKFRFWAFSELRTA